MYPDERNIHPLCVFCIIAFKWSRRADSQNHKLCERLLKQKHSMTDSLLVIV